MVFSDHSGGKKLLAGLELTIKSFRENPNAELGFSLLALNISYPYHRVASSSRPTDTPGVSDIPAPCFTGA